VKFDDIVGLESAKSALREVMDYMMNPSKYKDRGARMRRGILLYGPPGTGKTTLAKACAN
jgi:cell division protease FtsH